MRLLPNGEPDDVYSKAHQSHCGDRMEKVGFIHPPADGSTLPDLPKVFNKTDLMFLVSLLNETECSDPTENDK